jgi:D-alanine transaminase
MLAFYNGSFIDSTENIVSMEDRGYHFGDGVYEVIRVYEEKPFMLAEHLNRFNDSAAALKITVPYSNDQLIAFIEEGISRFERNNIDIYLQLTRGSGPRNHVFSNDIEPITTMIFRESKQIADEKIENGGAVILKEDERWANCYIKSLNLLPNVLARSEAAEKGCVEAILYKGDYVTEGSASNVFIVKDSIIYTTPLSKSILPGITRIAVLKIAKKLNVQVNEEHFTKEQLKNADECFITSTTSEVLPITSVDEQPIGNGKVGELTKQLYNEFQQYKR